MAAEAATQAWMQPMMEQVLSRSTTDSGAYTQAALASASHVTDPAVAAALGTLTRRSYSADADVANAVMLQQAQLTGQNTAAQATSQYQSGLSDIATQEAKYNADFFAANGFYPNQPVIGGIPLVPAPEVRADATGSPAWQALLAQSMGGGGSTPTVAPSAAAPAATPPPTFDANTLATVATMPPDPEAALQGVLAQGVVDVGGQQVDTQALWNQVAVAVGSGQITPSTQYYAERLGQAMGVAPAQVIALAQSQSAATGPPPLGPPPPTTVVTAPPPVAAVVPSASATAAPTDINQMFDSYGPTYARQWYTVNANALTPLQRQQAELWLQRHPQTTTPPGTTVPIAQIPQ